MYSESIIRAPVVFFLGAGASRPLGKPLMGEFIQQLENAQRFSGGYLFRRIVERKRDLEFLFEELEEWARKDYYAPLPSVGLISPLPTRPIGVPIDVSDARFLDDFRNVLGEAERLQSNLKREVFNTYREIQNPHAALRLFEPLFEASAAAWRPSRHPIVIFTTNYDPSIEISCEHSNGKYRLHDGFFHDEAAASYVWKKSQFDSYRPSADKTDIVLFKLHGSTSWTKTRGNVTKSPVAIFTEDDSTHENILIYPAERKVADQDPFFTAYDYFQRCAEQCHLCVAIGYSFRDYDALTKLMSATTNNPKLTVLVVDPNAEKLCKDLKARQIKAQPVTTTFGTGQGFEDYLLQVKSWLATALV